MRIKADTGVCVGAGQCLLTEPTVFDQDDEGIVKLLTTEPGEQVADHVRDAIGLCPSQALSIIEDD